VSDDTYSTLVAVGVGVFCLLIVVVGMYVFRFELAGKRRPPSDKERIAQLEALLHEVLDSGIEHRVANKYVVMQVDCRTLRDCRVALGLEAKD
jgi:hypothetical protein